MNKYSEQDIQDFATGLFAGNKSDFEEYLRLHPQFANQVKEYQLLFESLKADHSIALSFNLADKVLEKISQKKFSKEPAQFQLFQALLIALTAVAMIITFRHFEFELDYSMVLGSGIFIISASLIVFFLYAFYLVEIKQIRKKLLL
ncbi:MAG TPA: hypothetical protein VMZ69_10860 [Saprospiraceae bacterium]|nr:hypothetical protein [Saprospiraceae bacterium]